jgi:hypothetical protein
VDEEDFIEEGVLGIVCSTLGEMSAYTILVLKSEERIYMRRGDGNSSQRNIL